jgi:hypothetical protein
MKKWQAVDNWIMLYANLRGRFSNPFENSLLSITLGTLGTLNLMVS